MVAPAYSARRPDGVQVPVRAIVSVPRSSVSAARRVVVRLDDGARWGSSFAAGGPAEPFATHTRRHTDLDRARGARSNLCAGVRNRAGACGCPSRPRRLGRQARQDALPAYVPSQGLQVTVAEHMLSRVKTQIDRAGQVIEGAVTISLKSIEAPGVIVRPGMSWLDLSVRARNNVVRSF